jgi:hypothetical protein
MRGNYQNNTNLYSIYSFGADILDMDMEKARNRRWDRAFGKNVEIEEASRAYNRKATIVLEHLLQASDVAHTMQVCVMGSCISVHLDCVDSHFSPRRHLTHRHAAQFQALVYFS